MKFVSLLSFLLSLFFFSYRGLLRLEKKSKKNKNSSFSLCSLFFSLPFFKQVNVDFADVKAIMRDSGTAMLGVGVASGKGRAREAADAATSAPLIERSIERATGVVYNITGGRDMTLAEVNEVSQVVSSLADPSANVIFGAVRSSFF